MPVNITSESDKTVSKKQQAPTIPKSDRALVQRTKHRIQRLKDYRSRLKTNPYDDSGNAQSLEDLWDIADKISLPHKYSHPELQDWMANSSRPMVYAKIDTAISILLGKNPEVEMFAWSDKDRANEKMMKHLYDFSWYKSKGKQEWIKFANSTAKYGTGVGREYHKFKQKKKKVYTVYDPHKNKHEYTEELITEFDQPYFEHIPIRHAYFDPMAKPYNKDTMRDWCWYIDYDWSTFQTEYPQDRFPKAKYIQPNNINTGEVREDKLSEEKDVEGDKVRLWFYESKETDEFIITDGQAILYSAPLIDNELTCIVSMWRLRHEQTIYGIGLPEILQGDQELLDRVSNMTVNQIVLAISGAGFYGGSGNVKERDMILEPKLKKLRDAEKIQFVNIKGPDATVLKIIEDIRSESDEMSGITKSLTGEQVGKTLGEAVLNREAGLQRLSTPLMNLQLALEEQGRLRINNIQRIYGRPILTDVVIDEAANIIDDALLQEYIALRQEVGDSVELAQQFPSDPTTGALFRNKFKEARLMEQRDDQGTLVPSSQDNIIEVKPSDIRGEFDIQVKAFSTIPMSKTLQEAKSLETFNLIYKLPYTDAYKAQKRLLEKRNEEPDDWMLSEEEIAATQQTAQEAPPADEMQAMGQPMGAFGGKTATDTKTDTVLPPNRLQTPAADGGLTSQVTKDLS